MLWKKTQIDMKFSKLYYLLASRNNIPKKKFHLLGIKDILKEAIAGEKNKNRKIKY